MSESTPVTETERGRRKTMVGIVVSTKMDKTAVVAVEDRKAHPLYRKIIKSTKRYKAHDPNNTAILGDVVRIEETRPISKEKRWRIVQTMTRGNVADLAPRDIGAPEGAMEQKVAPVIAAREPEPVAEAPAAAETEVAAEPEAVAEPEVAAEAEEPTATEATEEASAKSSEDEAPA